MKISVVLKETLLNREDLNNLKLDPGRYARLTISDTGCGIDPSLMEKIFEPYFTTKDKSKGTGLGLAVVYGIVKEHHGEIKIHSEIGKGTTVNVFLPLMKKSFDAKLDEIPEKVQTGTERILVVDDEALIANLERQMLERLGYNVTERVSSSDALKAFNTNPSAFDLVISDMTMPNMTGEQLAKELLKIRPDIPIIICTGFSETLDSEKARSMGIMGFLMKPIILSDLAKMVRNVLDGAKNETQG